MTAYYVNMFQEGEFERGPWLEILDEEGKPVHLVHTKDKIKVWTEENMPSWAHGTPETNPHYPYEGPAMGWVHA